ncbi:MAG: diadenylate cyclase CdaA [Eubacterium sp.]|nr:diadenylate cyclase CdaA [Eubacterium sp.]
MNAIGSYLESVFNKYFAVPVLDFGDVIEIILIAILFYYIFLWFRKSRAWSLLKGISFLVIIMVVAGLLNLSTIVWLINKTLSAGIIAVVIIFQPELRRALEELGKKNVIFKVLKFGGSSDEDQLDDHSIDEITRATLEMGKAKTGALIVIQQEHDLQQYVETGIRVDAKISSQLLINIFEKNTPLHDGAVIIEANRIKAATCYLPLSDSISLSKDLGTRHRAGLGISEVTDGIVIIVSEETGSISIAREGKLIRYADAAIIKKELRKTQVEQEEKKARRFWKGRDRIEETNSKSEKDANK